MEPCPENYSLLLQKCCRQSPGAKDHNPAGRGRRNFGHDRIGNHLVSHDGLFIVRNTGMHTVLPELAPASATRIEVPCLTLDELIKSNGIAKIDFLKIDCEGTEYQILFGASADAIEKIDRIAMEIHETSRTELAPWTDSCVTAASTPSDAVNACLPRDE